MASLWVLFFLLGLLSGVSSIRGGYNVIFLSCDSMDGRLREANPPTTTPNLDKMAKMGVTFLNTYSNSPLCVPSRASFWSGKRVDKIQAWNNFKGLSPNDSTWRTYFDKADYKTAAFGKQDYLSGAHTVDARVDAWTRAANISLSQISSPHATLEGDNTTIQVHKGDWKTIEKCVQWLKEYVGNGSHRTQPFALYCGIDIPHPGFVTSPYWLNTVDPKKVTVPTWDTKLHPETQYSIITKNCSIPFTKDAIFNIRRTYYAMVNEADAMIGTLFQTVEQLGIADTTFRLFISDHGEMNMEHRQYYKSNYYEPSARVPMILVPPSKDGQFVRGKVVTNFTQLLDIFPTLMDIAGIPHPTDIDGYSLFPFILAKPSNQTRPDWILGQYHGDKLSTGTFMLRWNQWKYIKYVGQPDQLFDLVNDPEELTDLTASRPDIVKMMDTKLQSIIDYKAVDNTAKLYDKTSFVAWRNSIGSNYTETMKQIFPGFGPTQQKQIDDWLAGFQESKN